MSYSTIVDPKGLYDLGDQNICIVPLRLKSERQVESAMSKTYLNCMPDEVMKFTIIRGQDCR